MQWRWKLVLMNKVLSQMLVKVIGEEDLQSINDGSRYVLLKNSVGLVVHKGTP